MRKYPCFHCSSCFLDWSDFLCNNHQTMPRLSPFRRGQSRFLYSNNIFVNREHHFKTFLPLRSLRDNIIKSVVVRHCSIYPIAPIFRDLLVACRCEIFRSRRFSAGSPPAEADLTMCFIIYPEYGLLSTKEYEYTFNAEDNLQGGGLHYCF